MKKLILIASILSVLSACSTIVSKSEYAVAIASTPDAAKFTITNKSSQQVHSGVTPATVTLKSSSGYFKAETYKINFKKDGHPDKVITMKSTLDGWYFGNILLGGLVGMLIVDPITGAMYSLPKRLDVSLDEPVSSLNNKDLTIATIDSISELEKQSLVKLN